MNWRLVVPNLFTALSLSLGIGSVFAAILGSIDWSAWLILWCVLLDKVDGTAARLLKATSRFGSEFDSFADVAAFGFAPAVLVFQALRGPWGTPSEGLEFWVSALGCGLYALLTAVRLTRFNVTEHRPGERWFTGLPTTVCGAMVASGILVATRYGLPAAWAQQLPIGLAILGLGMVSRIPVPKVVARRNLAFNLFQLANVAAVYACGILRIAPEYLLGLTWFYLVVGITFGLIKGAGIEAETPSKSRDAPPSGGC